MNGTGGINNNAYIANLFGQLCAPGVGYILSGSVQIYAQTAAAGTAASGTLVAFGGTDIPPNPVPNSGPSLVSIVGGQWQDTGAPSVKPEASTQVTHFGVRMEQVKAFR